MEIKNAIKQMIPGPIKRTIKDLIGITALNARISELIERIVTIEDNYWGEDTEERSKKRWRESEPERGLTWGKIISGNHFVKKMQSYMNFDNEKKILEIGPGYGRLLKSCLEMKIPFKKYVGLDISQKNVDFLKSTFQDESIEFINGDVENYVFSEKFDIVCSSLTFKHLFPSFEKALENIIKYINPGGIIFFDLLEGNKRIFEEDLVTYVHSYTRKEVTDILRKISLDLVSFDQVKHAADCIRLLVVARNPNVF
jgi:SAM-dependent methyltransferase